MKSLSRFHLLKDLRDAHHYICTKLLSTNEDNKLPSGNPCSYNNLLPLKLIYINDA